MKMNLCKCGVVKVAHVDVCGACEGIVVVTGNSELKVKVKAANKAAIKLKNGSTRKI